MNVELKFCVDCGTKTLEVEEPFLVCHCANCGQFFRIVIDESSLKRKGFILFEEENKDPNHGKSDRTIATSAPSAFGWHGPYKIKVDKK